MSPFRVHDTRTKRGEAVETVSPRHLRLYACGPTVYRYAHVGNLRTFLLTDLIQRVAVYRGWQVTVVQNVTDVGHMEEDGVVEALTAQDKVLAQAVREGKDPFAVARFYEDAFHVDLGRLNVRPAAAYPRASESIELMLELIARLIVLGHAYATDDGSVFFDAKSFPSYGALSGNRLDALRPGHRFDGGVDERKRFHADWALWKHAGDRRAMVWDSPWGPGFPGWHIECSAMSMDLLGDRIDLHTGGIDLRFPHHEDERAQSNAAVGAEVVNRWVHAEHLLFEGRKMAKSTGNVVLVDDVVARGLDPLALRLAFLESRYRTQVDLSWDALAAADRLLHSWRGLVADWAEHPSQPMHAPTVDAAVAAYEDDLDTPRAVQALRRLARDESVGPGARFETFAHLDALLGLDLVRHVGRPRELTVPEGARELLDQRVAARAARDYAESDRLRDALAAIGLAVTDTADGQTWSLT